MTVRIADLPERLRAGQEKALPALIDHFALHDRGILWMCCGSGKTVTCAIYIEMRGEPVTVVFTPFINLAKQWRRDYLKWIPNTEAQFMCICSENDPVQELDPLEVGRLMNASANTSAEEFAELVAEAERSQTQAHGQTRVSTDPAEVAAFLRQEGRKVIICTYDSSPVFGEAQRIAGVRSNLGVFDEAQRTANGNKNNDSTHALHDSNVDIAQRLFTTATVRHYTRDGMVYSMDNEELYGSHVLVDANGNPDPWTMRQAIEHEEAPPYRIVFSFVTDPSFEPQLVQLPPYRDLTIEVGTTADPAEVQRLIGQAMALERIKAKYGVKKPLGFFNRVATARLYTDILNACKRHSEYFPHLYTSEQAEAISAYDPRAERDRRMAHLHNSRETEINNAKLLMIGSSVDDIDAVQFGDPMTDDSAVIQACGRAQRYLPGKISTIIVPVMLPYYGNDLATHARQIDRDQIHDAFHHLTDILDSLADMDPILRNQINMGTRQSNGDPGIIEFDFPETFLPQVQRAIKTEIWRVINPQTDFIDNLERDAATLNQYRMEQFPTEEDPEKEAEAVQARAEIRIIPRDRGYETTADRMYNLRLSIKAYYESGERKGRHGAYVITANRIEHVYRIYGWDKDFVLRDDFEENLKQDAIALDKYRLEIHPTKDEQQEEAESARLRSQIKIIPKERKGYMTASRRMNKLRREIKAYFEAEQKEGRYGSFALDSTRVKQVFDTYGWDESFIRQDEFEENLKQDAIARDKYRLETYPTRDDPEEEAKAAQARSQIQIIPGNPPGYETAATRMRAIRRSLKAYLDAGKQEGKYELYTLNAERVDKIYRIYGWDETFVRRDEFEENLKQDAAALEKYRLEQYPKLDDSKEESEAAQARAQIRIIPIDLPDYEVVGARMGAIRRSLKAYFDAEQKEGSYKSYYLNPNRVKQILDIYGWDENFIRQDDFKESLREDAIALAKYRLEQYPQKDNPKEETEAAKLRAQIRIIPADREGYETTGTRMGSIRRALKAYFDSGKKEGRYDTYFIDSERVQQVFDIYDWDEVFVRRDDFEEKLKQDVVALEEYRFEQHPKLDDPEKELEAARLRAQIRIVPKGQGHNATATRMRNLRRNAKAYLEAKNQKHNAQYRITPARLEQIYRIYGWDEAFIRQDNFEEDLKRDVIALEKYRLEVYPKKDDPEEEAEVAKLRTQIRIIPAGQGYREAARRMKYLRQDIKFYYQNQEEEKTYSKYNITSDRIKLVYRTYGWDKDFVLSDLRIGSRRHRKEETAHHHFMPRPSDVLIALGHRSFKTSSHLFPEPIL